MMIHDYGLNTNNWWNGQPDTTWAPNVKPLYTYFRIDGDPDDLDDNGTLTLTVKHHGKWYRTYTIPSMPGVNTYPNQLVISDEKGLSGRFSKLL